MGVPVVLRRGPSCHSTTLCRVSNTTPPQPAPLPFMLRSTLAHPRRFQLQPVFFGDEVDQRQLDPDGVELLATPFGSKSSNSTPWSKLSPGTTPTTSTDVTKSIRKYTHCDYRDSIVYFWISRLAVILSMLCHNISAQTLDTEFHAASQVHLPPPCNLNSRPLSINHTTKLHHHASNRS